VESEQLAKQAERLSHQTTSVTAWSDRAARLDARMRNVEVAGRRFEVRVLEPEPPWAELARRHAERARGGRSTQDETVVSPMQGTVLKLEVAEGDTVESGQVVAVVEAMKMENEITAHRSGTVVELAVAPGEPVTAGQAICVISD
jgi:acetyl-CoA/propionyl-CoA carboxylase biotin carboxyl carrier protein